jgi:uncharacterized protein (DUF427 family)
MPFEGNYYIQRKCLRTEAFKVNWIPGFCIYKFLFVWMDLHLNNGDRVGNLAWMYWLPNPLIPFIWFRVAIPAYHSEIEIQQSPPHK